MRPDKILFDTKVTATGGRDGTAASPDGRFKVSLSVPTALGGPGGDGTNPEQLFAAGYAACFLSALKVTGRLNKTPLPEDAAVTVRVGIGPVEIGYGLTAELSIDIPGLDRSVAETLVAGAHERCPYSRATRGNVDVTIRLV